MQRYRYSLISRVAQDELASAEIAADGSFEVDAQGEIIVRLEYGYDSAWFFPEDPGETRVQVVNLRQWTGN